MPLTAKHIRLQTIITRIRRYLSPTNAAGVGLNDPLSKFFVGGNYAVLAPDLNGLSTFKADGLALHPDDLRSVTDVEDLIIAVRDWYKRNNWTILV